MRADGPRYDRQMYQPRYAKRRKVRPPRASFVNRQWYRASAARTACAIFPNGGPRAFGPRSDSSATLRRPVPPSRALPTSFAASSRRVRGSPRATETTAKRPTRHGLVDERREVRERQLAASRAADVRVIGTLAICPLRARVAARMARRLAEHSRARDGPGPPGRSHYVQIPRFYRRRARLRGRDSRSAPVFLTPR